MKWVYRLFSLLFIAAAIGLPFFIDNKQGEPMLSLPQAGDLLPSKSATPDMPIPGTTTRVFKWQDAEGIWHYGDQAPEGQVHIQTVEVDSRANIIQSFKRPREDGSADNNAQGTAAQMTPDNDSFLTMDRAMNVMKDAKLAAKAMEERNETLGQIVGE